MKKRKVTLIFRGVVALLIAGFIMLLVSPSTDEATSPNGRLVARVTNPSLLDMLFANYEGWSKTHRVRIVVTDLQTNEKVTARDEDSSGLFGGDGEGGLRVRWSRDNKEFTYDYVVEPIQKECTYEVKTQPLRVHEKDGGDRYKIL